MTDAEGGPGEELSLLEPGLVVTALQLEQMVAHCLSCYPEEGCGLLVGDPSALGATGSGAVVLSVQPVANMARSAQVYEVDPRAHLRIDREAEAAGHAVIGVFHSHTHTDPYPSPTDVRQAPDPSWHYVLVSLRHQLASVRSYQIVDGNIREEAVVITGR